ARALSGNGATQTGEGSRDLGGPDVHTDARRSASLFEEPRRGLLCRTSAWTAKLRAKPTATAHQQRRRRVPTRVVGAKRAPHSGTVWSRQRSAALGTEVG